MQDDVWSIYSGDINWEEGGKSVHRPSVWRGKRWGLVNLRTSREIPPTAPYLFLFTVSFYNTRNCVANLLV
jgi:hypothetical protein